MDQIAGMDGYAFMRTFPLFCMKLRLFRRMVLALGLLVTLLICAGPASAVDTGSQIKPGPMINGDEPLLGIDTGPFVDGDDPLESIIVVCLRKGEWQLVCEGSLTGCLLKFPEVISDKDCQIALL
jgi:hypothetical protein